MARRRRYSIDPVAARQRKIVLQCFAFTLLAAVAGFMVFMAMTSS